MDSTDLYIDIDETLKIKCSTLNNLEDCKNELTKYNFKVLSCNVRGLQHKASTGQLFVALKRLDISYDALVFSECWYNESNPHVPTIPGYKDFHTTKVINKCGGVTIYIKESWSADALEPTFDNANCLTVNVANQANIIGIYRSPSFDNTNNFITSLDYLLESMKDKNIIIAGDININLLDEKPGSSSSIYQCLMTEYGFLPAITQPTRCDTCIDHIFVNSKGNVSGLICNCSLTDHSLTMVGIDLTRSKVSKKLTNRDTTRTDFTAIVKDLHMMDWSKISEMNNVNDAVNLLDNYINTLVEKHSHRINVSRNKHCLKPWITPGLIRCMRHRDKLHLQSRKQPENAYLKITYNRYKNFCNNLLRKVKSNYENMQLEKHHRNPKKLWRAIKDICDIPRPKNDSHELLNSQSSPQEATNACNLHFATVGPKLAASILDRLSTTQESLSSSLNIESHSPDSIFLYATDQYEVNSLISELKTDSAPGIDLFTSSLLKQIKFAIVEPLTHICNLSLETGVFPDAWKIAVVCPIHKNGSKVSIDNYRPISLLPILSKILEKIVNNRLVNYLEKHNLLSKRQFGFRRGKSTEDAVELLTSTLSKHLDIGNRSLGVFLDLAKAFDTVSIPMLLKKLECLGVRGNALKWFSSYLSERRQRLKIGEYLSNEQCIYFGVPQGSILSPTLFTIYMNDILELNIPNAEIICYADDTVVIFYGNTWQSTIYAAEVGMTAIANWLDNNLLTLNINKTHFVAFHINRATEPKISFINLHTNSCATLRNSLESNYGCSCQRINRISTIKYLGVLIDQNLSFESHITTVSKRARKLIFLMKTLRTAASLDVRKLVYTSLCQTLLQYCIGIWGGAAKSFMIDLERAQRAILKVMIGKPRRYATQELYHDTGVLSVRKLFVMRAIEKVQSTVQASQNKRKRQVRIETLPLPRVRTVFASRLPLFIHIFVYNAICKSCDLRECSRMEARSRVKNWLITKSYEEVETLVKVYGLQ